MHIPNTSAFASVNALARTLAYHAFQDHEHFFSYLRWLDQSYGDTVACTLSRDLSAAVAMHGVHHLTLNVAQKRLRVVWARPEAQHRLMLARISSLEELTHTADGGSLQFYIDTKLDGYLLRDLTNQLHEA